MVTSCHRKSLARSGPELEGQKLNWNNLRLRWFCIEDDRSELEDKEIEELNRIVSARVLFTKCKVEWMTGRRPHPATPAPQLRLSSKDGSFSSSNNNKKREATALSAGRQDRTRSSITTNRLSWPTVGATTSKTTISIITNICTTIITNRQRTSSKVRPRLVVSPLTNQLVIKPR